MSTPLLTGCTDTSGCKGRLSWTFTDHWRAKCDKCSLTTRASTMLANILDKLGASRG